MLFLTNYLHLKTTPTLRLTFYRIACGVLEWNFYGFRPIDGLEPVYFSSNNARHKYNTSNIHALHTKFRILVNSVIVNTLLCVYKSILLLVNLI